MTSAAISLNSRTDLPNLGIMSLNLHGYENLFRTTHKPSTPVATVLLLQVNEAGIPRPSARNSNSEISTLNSTLYSSSVIRCSYASSQSYSQYGKAVFFLVVTLNIAAKSTSSIILFKNIDTEHSWIDFLLNILLKSQSSESCTHCCYIDLKKFPGTTKTLGPRPLSVKGGTSSHTRVRL